MTTASSAVIGLRHTAESSLLSRAYFFFAGLFAGFYYYLYYYFYMR